MFLALVVGGLSAFRSWVVQNRPTSASRSSRLNVGYAGVPPSQWNRNHAQVEDAVSTIVGIETITSTVTTGSSNTTIEFQFGSDLSQAMDDVRDAISRIRPNMPLDATEPNISRSTTAGNAVLTFAVASDNLSDTELSWFVDLNVMRDISGVPGVGQVNRIGGVTREVRVDLDPDRMAALGVTAGDISSQLVRTQVELPGGETRIGAQEQNVRTLGTISSVQELAALPISLGDGRNVRLDALADVRDQAAEVRQEVLLDGKPVIGFQVMRAWGEGALKVADGTRAAVEKIKRDYPNIQVTEINAVQDAEIRESFHTSMIMLVEGALLAILVVWFFLKDIRATLISAAALPLSVIPTFWALHVFGFSMNTLTMLALTLVVGMLVDDAIVEVENIVRHLRMGKPPLQAATTRRSRSVSRSLPHRSRCVRGVHPGHVHGRHRGRVIQTVWIHGGSCSAVLAAGRPDVDADDGLEVHAGRLACRDDGALQGLVHQQGTVGAASPSRHHRRLQRADDRGFLARDHAADRFLAQRRFRLGEPQCEPAARLHDGGRPSRRRADQDPGCRIP